MCTISIFNLIGINIFKEIKHIIRNLAYQLGLLTPYNIKAKLSERIF